MYGPYDWFLTVYNARWRSHFRSTIPLWKSGNATIKQPLHVSDLVGNIFDQLISFHQKSLLKFQLVVSKLQNCIAILMQATHRFQIAFGQAPLVLNLAGPALLFWELLPSRFLLTLSRPVGTYPC